MDTSNEPLEPISFDQLLEGYHSRKTLYENSESEEGKSSSDLVDKSLAILQKVKENNPLQVTLRIPKKYAKDVANGMLTVNEGVLRHTHKAGAKAGQIQAHLKQVKGIKLANLATMGIGIAQELLVNDKLNALSTQLNEIDEKLTAIIEGQVQGALNAASTVGLIQDLSQRKTNALAVKNTLLQAEATLQVEADRQWHDIEQLRERLENRSLQKKVSNSSSQQQLFNLMQALPQTLESILVCKLARAEMYHQAEEKNLADQTMAETVAWIAQHAALYIHHFEPERLSEFLKAKKGILDLRANQALKRQEENMANCNEYMLQLTLTSMAYHMAQPTAHPEPNSQAATSTNTSFLQRLQLWFKGLLKR